VYFLSHHFYPGIAAVWLASWPSSAVVSVVLTLNLLSRVAEIEVDLVRVNLMLCWYSGRLVLLCWVTTFRSWKAVLTTSSPSVRIQPNACLPACQAALAVTLTSDWCVTLTRTFIHYLSVHVVGEWSSNCCPVDAKVWVVQMVCMTATFLTWLSRVTSWSPPLSSAEFQGKDCHSMYIPMSDASTNTDAYCHNIVYDYYVYLIALTIVETIRALSRAHTSPPSLTSDLDLLEFNHLVPCGQGYDWPSLLTFGLELVPGSCSQTYTHIPSCTDAGENITSHHLWCMVSDKNCLLPFWCVSVIKWCRWPWQMIFNLPVTSY